MSESKQSTQEIQETQESDFTDMDSFINHIFSNLPQDPCSIQFIPVSDEPDIVPANIAIILSPPT